MIRCIRTRTLKAEAEHEMLLQPQVVYGYFPCNADGNDLIIYQNDGKTEQTRFTFPRQEADRHLCLADYFAAVASGRKDVVAFHMVTMGKKGFRAFGQTLCVEQL